MDHSTDETIAPLLRQDWARAVSAVIGSCGDIDLAESAAAEALAEAGRKWPTERPPEAGNWIVATARQKAAELGAGPADPAMVEPVRDERLGLIFACCHPSLPEAARVALVLRLVGGLSTARIADAFMVPEDTMRLRMARAKARLRDHHLPYRDPAPDEWGDRLTCVLAVVHLIFDEGYHSPRPAAPQHDDLAGEAVLLGRTLLDLFPDEPEARGLLALMLMTRARRDARVGEDLTLIALGSQDRTRWRRDEIDEGLFLLRQCQRSDRTGPYQLRAAIQAVHCEAESLEATDWQQILALYDHLMLIAASDEVALDRVVAVAEVEGPATALDAVERLGLDTHVYHAVRADLLTRLGRTEEADRAWTAAVARVRGATEHAELRDQLAR